MRANLATLVETWRKNGNDVAIVRHDGNRTLRQSYRDLARDADRVAAELARRGIVAGDRVVLWGANSAQWVAAFFGLMLCGVLVVPLDATGSIDFAERVIADTTPKLLFGDAELLARLTASVPWMGLEEIATLPPAPAAAPPPGLGRSSPLQILYTSGTTSEPKGIVHTHGNVLASVEPIEREMLKYRRYERWVHPLRFLHTLPMSHVFGQFMGLWLPALLGTEVHFESRLEAERIVRTLHRERITLLAAVPRVLELLRGYLLAQDRALRDRVAAAAAVPVRRRLWHFRDVHGRLGWKFWAFVCGGASLSPELEQFWSTLGFAVVQGYGMTETAALITLNHPFKISRGSIGKALPGREVKIGADGEVSVRGEMVSTATWQGGRMVERADSWLATGDLASRDAEGNLRFTGRKSEVIVTAAGLNIHPEDVEAALSRQPGVRACAVVPFGPPGGGDEPAAVLVVPGGLETAARAVVLANVSLAEFQRVRRWFVWPDADLPRTATGKVQRPKVAAWVQERGTTPEGAAAGPDDLLLRLIESITGSPSGPAEEEARLGEDLHLDSLGRVQLQSAMKARFGITVDDSEFAAVETLGQLRVLTLGPAGAAGLPAIARNAPASPPGTRTFFYPRWPWAGPVAALRTLFAEVVSRPLVWLLLRPRVRAAAQPLPTGPMLVVANHVTFFDLPIILYGLPWRVRRKVAVAMAGEMLDDWRLAQNQGSWWMDLLGPPQYWLVTALFHAFPLPRQAGFRRSFAHVGELLDCGYHVVVFPEGTRSRAGVLQPFRGGIGMLATESQVPVLPVGLYGMDKLVADRSSWFHAGLVEIRVGEVEAVAKNSTPEKTARHLHAHLEKLLADGGSRGIR